MQDYYRQSGIAGQTLHIRALEAGCSKQRRTYHTSCGIVGIANASCPVRMEGRWFHTSTMSWRLEVRGARRVNKNEPIY